MIKMNVLGVLVCCAVAIASCAKTTDESKPDPVGTEPAAKPVAAEPTAPASPEPPDKNPHATEQAGAPSDSAPVSEGSATVTIGDKEYQLRAKMSAVTSVLMLQGGEIGEDYQTLTMGIPAGFGPGSYNNDRDNFVKEKFMAVGGNRSGDTYQYDPASVFKIDVAADGADYVFTFSGGLLLAEQKIPVAGKIRLSKDKFAPVE